MSYRIVKTTTMILNPIYDLFLLFCSRYDILKLFPLLLIAYGDDGRHYCEFLFLAIGDLAMIYVSSLQETMSLFIGVVSFTLFVGLRLYHEYTTLEINTIIEKCWLLPIIQSVVLVIIKTQHIIQTYLLFYILALHLLLYFAWCHDYRSKYFRGYNLYLLSDFILLISFISPFDGSKIVVRYLYWRGLSDIYL